MDSLARASRHANVDPPRRHLGVFLLLGRSRARCRSPFPDSPAEPCMPLSGHTALPLSVILSLDL